LVAFSFLISSSTTLTFYLNRINRPYFEDQAQEVLCAPDLRNISAHYSRDRGSGFWLYEYGDQVIGLIAVDASNKPDDNEKSSASKSKGKTATIRHFYVDEPYRVANIQEDLLKHAVNHAFSDPKVQRIEASDSPLVPYLRACLRNAGFQLDHNTKKIGLLRWNVGVRYMSRDEWKGE
jgi:GNAT superfamily N-acetyltransferase